MKTERALRPSETNGLELGVLDELGIAMLEEEEVNAAPTPMELIGGIRGASRSLQVIWYLVREREPRIGLKDPPILARRSL